MCKGLTQLGARVTVYTTDSNGPSRLNVPLGQLVKLDNISVFYFPTSINFPGYSFQLARQINQKIKEFDIVLILAVWSPILITTAKAAMKAKIPYIIQLHGQLLPWSLRQKFLKKKIFLELFIKRYLTLADALFCTDIGEAIALQKLNINKKAFVVPNSVDFSEFKTLPEKGYLRELFHISNQACLLLFLGRLHHKKRPDIALETLAMVIKTLNIDCHLVFAGPDEMSMKERLLKQAKIMGIESRLHFTGLLNPPEVRKAIVDSDLLLMPSEPESENFGMSAIEALAAGLPILVSEGVPVGKWAVKKGAGKIASCTGQAFSHATIELLKNPGSLQKMGESGRQMVQEEFDLLPVSRHLLIHLREVIESRKP